MHPKVTRKGQVTIPIEVRERLNIREGDTVYFTERDDHVVILRPEDLSERTKGALAKYAENRPAMEPHEMRELVDLCVTEEAMQSLKDNE